MGNKVDGSIVRAAGNILSGLSGLRVTEELDQDALIAVRWAVLLARAIVVEVERTEPDHGQLL